MVNWLKRSFLLASLVALTVPGLASAQDAPPYATFDIKLGNAINTDHVLKVTPEVSSEITKDTVAFHIFNNTGKEIYFVDGDQKQYIPLVSHNTVQASYYPGKEYMVFDMEDNAVASWTLGDAPVASANVTSASATDFSDWSQKLGQVIQNQQVTYEVAPAKPEPHYYNSTSSQQAAPAAVEPAAAPSYPAQQNKVIRGYW